MWQSKLSLCLLGLCISSTRSRWLLSLFEKKSCESAADQKNRDLQEYILPKSNANSHTNIYTNNDMQTIFLRPCYCCKAIGVIIVVDVLVVVHVAVYLVEHMDTNDFYLGFGYSEARAAAVFSALSDFNSTRSHFLSLLSFFLRLRFLSFSFYLFVSGAFRSAVACLHGFIIDSSFRCWWMHFGVTVYGFVCVHNGVTNICVFRFEMNNNESFETYIRYVYISLPQQRNHIIINIYMRVCLCQTLNWQPYQITGSLFHRRSIEEIELELRSER